MVEEDQAICIPSGSAQLGITINGSLAGKPKAVESREDSPKPVVCCGRDTIPPGRVRKRLPVLLAH